MMEHWDRREKVFDGNTPEDIIEDFELAKVMMDCFSIFLITKYFT